MGVVIKVEGLVCRKDDNHNHNMLQNLKARW